MNSIFTVKRKIRTKIKIVPDRDHLSFQKGKVFLHHIYVSWKKQLERILVYWTENKDIRGALVSVHYKHIVAKSNR